MAVHVAGNGEETPVGAAGDGVCVVHCGDVENALILLSNDVPFWTVLP